MRTRLNNFLIKRSVFLVGIAASSIVCAEDVDRLQLNASVQSIWDSNFSRSPLNDSEQSVLSSVGFRFDDTFGRQRLIAKWDVHRYQYDEHPDFDATTDTGQLSLKGALGSLFTTDVDFQRNAYQVDRLEFFGKDIVTRDDLNAKLGYGSDNRLSFHLGARKSTQEHSNDARDSLDFEEREGFVDAGFQTNNKSSIYFRYKSGKRTYTHSPVDIANPISLVDLDFNYQQLELDSRWALTAKTSISAFVARYKRDGDINDATGSLASIAGEWQATEKINVTGGYTLSEPAVGETSDSPSKVKTLSLNLLWQYSSKWSFGSRAAYSVVDYDKLPPEFVREEKAYNFSPLAVSFDSGHYWKFRVDSGWRKNESSTYVRNYISRQVNAGLYLSF